GPLWSSGGDRGLYKTTDGGVTWRAVLRISEHTGVTDMAMDPRDPNVIYASAFQRRRRVGQLIGGGPESAIYKTTDGGETWKKLTHGIPAVDKGRIALAVSPQKPDVVYALVTAAGKESGLFRSADGGETWVRKSNYQVIDPQYYGEIYADPHHFDRIYAMDVWIQVSENGGQTFRPLRWNMHVDNHAMIFDPTDPKHLLVGNDGGLYESFDYGDTWRHFTNLPTSQFYRVALDDAEPFYHVYGGTQDNGSMAGPSRTLNRVGIRASEWIRTRGGDGFQTRIDPTDPETIYTLSQNGDLGRLDKRTGISKPIRPRLAEGDAKVRWHWDSPLILSPHSPSRLYFAGSRLFRSDDRGESWTAVSSDLTRQLDRDSLPIMGRVWGEDAVQKNRFTTELSVITALEESRLAEGLLVVGTDDGLLQVSENGGEVWRRVDAFPGVPEGTYVSDICLSSHDAATMVITFNNHKRGDFRPYVLKTTDLGKTWESISSNLPSRHVVWSIIQDPIQSELYFLGTELGLFFTIDGGKQWIPMKNGVPPIAFRDLAIHSREHDLVGATFGRGFFILDDITALRHLSEMTLQEIEEGGLFPTRDAWVYQEIGYVEAQFGDFTTPNPPFGCTLWYYLPEEVDGSFALAIETKDGSPVRTLPIPNESGMNAVTWDLRMGPENVDRTRLPPRLRNQRHRALVPPGAYKLRLLHLENDRQSTVGEERTMTVKACPSP
ncbi:MAG: glycosyl hydrolase, partial [Planctomycetota bacterium]